MLGHASQLKRIISASGEWANLHVQKAASVPLAFSVECSVNVHCFLASDPGQIKKDKGLKPEKQTVVCCSLALDCLPPCCSPSLLSPPPHFLLPSLFLLVPFLKSCSHMDVF